MHFQTKPTIIFISLVTLFLLSSAFAQKNYQSYSNDRFHFSIDYPAALFTPEEAPTNGDGLKFSNDEASLTAWGNLFLEDIYQDMEGLFQSATENHEVTYSLLEPTFFIASGFTPEGNIFYRRSDLLDDVVYNFLIEYPKDRNYIYDSITTQIADSFTLPIASYDCNLASTESEKLICGFPRLSLYDARIAKAYRYLQENSPTKFAEELKIQQREWLNRRDACNTLTGETIFVCNSEEMFSRAEYLSVLEHMLEDFVDETSYSLVEDSSCEEAVRLDIEAFVEKNAAYANLPYSSHVNYWSYCFGQQALFKHALASNETELHSYVLLRNSLLDLMGAYNLLRQSQAGGGSMYIMLYANAHQWVETEFSYILDSYKTDSNKTPERVLKRAGLGLNPSQEDKYAALQAATIALENKLSYTADFLIDCCQESYDPVYLEEYKEGIDQATEDIKTGLMEIVTLISGLDLYIAHELLALADDMNNWFDIR